MRTHRWSLLVLASIPLLFGSFRAEGPRFTWWTTHAMDKVRPLDPVPAEVSNGVRLSAARNEFEAFQIVLRADRQQITGVDVEASDLTGPGGATISRENVAIHFERFLDLKTPSSIEGGAGEWPDPLIPRVDAYFGERRSAFPFTLADGRNQPIWLDMYVPIDAVAGAYRGQVKIAVNGKTEIEVPVAVEVWKFALPSTSSLPNTFGFSGIGAVREHRGRYTNDEDVYALTRLYQIAALRNRMTVHGGSMAPPRFKKTDGRLEMDWTSYDAETAPFLDGQIFPPGSPLEGARWTTAEIRDNNHLADDSDRILYYREFARHFRDRGWFDRLFYYLSDEPTERDSDKLLHRGRLVHEADPEIRNLVTTALRGSWIGTVDIWTPLINCVELKPGHKDFCNPTVPRQAYDAELSAGKELWWYQSCASHGCNIVGGPYFRGWPSYMVDHSPMANRIMPWLTWTYDIGGLLYFNLNQAYSSKTDAWNDVHVFGGNGDGTLLYAGRPDRIGGKTDVPIESIRFKLMRESLEDYEYLRLLSAKAGRNYASELARSLAPRLYDYERDPAALYRLRERIGKELSR